MMNRVIFILLNLLILLCGIQAQAAASFIGKDQSVLIQFDHATLSAPEISFVKRISQIHQATIVVNRLDLGNVSRSQAVVISVGQTEVFRQLSALKAIQIDFSKIPAEGFILKSLTYENTNFIFVIGQKQNADTNIAELETNNGQNYGLYKLLEKMGYSFLHPLSPIVPQQLSLPENLSLAEAPRWPVRGFHLHTMHPIELTEVLNGWGFSNPYDKNSWTLQLNSWKSYLEWLIANGQNRVQWIILRSKNDPEFNDSPERWQRIQKIVQMAHTYGVWVGIDLPIALEQQNAYRLIDTFESKASELQQLHRNIDRLFKTGIDYLVTEMGFSEFSSPDDDQMLQWMNEMTRYTDEKYHRSSFVKIHVSTNQKSKKYLDPETNQPLNFNFLSHFANPKLGILAHTVEVYSLTDPAPTYGNSSFNEILRFMQMESGKRPVVWHPETSYWVGYDVDVPLFLPVYGERRLFDLRLIANKENNQTLGRKGFKDAKIDGQIVFTSGWEWGYWLNDVISARAAWNPHLEFNEDIAFKTILRDIFQNFGSQREQLMNLISSLCNDQKDILINGKINGQNPKEIKLRSGLAYLSGIETWHELGTLVSDITGHDSA